MSNDCIPCDQCGKEACETGNEQLEEYWSGPVLVTRDWREYGCNYCGYAFMVEVRVDAV